MIGLLRGICDRGEDILAFKKRVIPKDFVERCTVGQKLQHIDNADVLAANAGLTAALAGLDRDA